MDELAEISEDIPSECARKLINGEVDLGLIPIATLPKVPNGHIISDYCIGADGPVKTVCIYAERPLAELDGIYLDYQSRTSVALAKLLLKLHWKLFPNLIDSEPGFEQKIKGKMGALVIGDRAIGLEDQYPYVYDLAREWKRFTGLPFVFAAWVANKPLPDYFTNRLNDSFEFGMAHRQQLADLLSPSLGGFDLYAYYTKYLSYNLDTRKREAMNLFLQMAEEHKILNL